MEKKRPLLPSEKGYDKAYELSYQLASQKLLGTPDLEGQCQRSGAEYDVTPPRSRIRLPYLGQVCEISLPEIEIIPARGSEQLSLRDKLLILHYFNTAKGTPPTNRLVTFRELPDGPVYFPTFTKRTVKPIVDRFGHEPELLTRAAEFLGGRESRYGDVGITITAFPRVSITIALWKGDEEFPANGNVLFDANINDYLPTEDITVLSETVAWKLVRSLRT